MEVVSTIITIALLLVAVLLIVVVLMQKTKSAGMGSAFGGDTQSFTARGKAASREAKLQKTTVDSPSSWVCWPSCWRSWADRAVPTGSVP